VEFLRSNNEGKPKFSRSDYLAAVGGASTIRSSTWLPRTFEGGRMADEWMIRGPEFVNCNCAWGCPCQFGSSSTHGFCEAVCAGRIEEGYFNETRLDSLSWVLLVHWPGEIKEGNGQEQAIVDERATPDQRDALEKILHGESTNPGATMFFIYNSTMTTVHETLYAPIELQVDVEGRTASLSVEGIVEATGSPIMSEFTGESVGRQIHFAQGFEFTQAEIGTATTQATGAIELHLTDTNGIFGHLHLTHAGVVR
jgi:hypothetical protein